MATSTISVSEGSVSEFLSNSYVISVGSNRAGTAEGPVQGEICHMGYIKCVHTYGLHAHFNESLRMRLETHPTSDPRWQDSVTRAGSCSRHNGPSASYRKV